MASTGADMQLFVNKLNKAIGEGIKPLVGMKVAFPVAQDLTRKTVHDFLANELHRGFLKAEYAFLSVLTGQVVVRTDWNNQLTIDCMPLVNTLTSHPKIGVSYGLGDPTKPKWNVWTKTDLQTVMMVHTDTEEEALQKVSELTGFALDTLDACRVGRAQETT